MGPKDPNRGGGSGGRDFVFWPEEHGGKRPEVDLRAVAKRLAPSDEPAWPDGLMDEVEPEPNVYPATSEWRRTTSRTVSNDEERWWESVAPTHEAPTGVPSPFEVKPAPAKSLMTPDEIWEMTARELADTPVLRDKAPPSATAPAAPERASATQPPTVETNPAAREAAAPKSFPNTVLPRRALACDAAVPGRAEDGPAPSASLKASPFTIATGAELFAGLEPASALRTPAATGSFDDELVFPRPGKPLPEDDDPEPRDNDPLDRRIVTICRLILLLLVGAGVVAFFYRSELSAIDWRGLWGNAMRSVGLSGLDSTEPARRAVPGLGQLKSRSSSNGQGDQSIESGRAPSRADATPVATEPVAANPDSSLVPEPPKPPTGGEAREASPSAGVEPAAFRDGPVKAQLSTSDQSQATEAQTAVQNLIKAESVEKLLPWIFDSAGLSPTVRNYHVTHPLKALNGAVVELAYAGTIASSGAKAYIFNVIHPDHPRGFPVSAEQTHEGYRIDWQSYIQWRHEWLRRFVENKSAEPQMLFVVLRRAHYFNDDVPRLDEKLCFKISSAVPGDEGTFAFVDHPSALARSLTSTYEWRKLYFPVVEVQWIREPNGAPYVRLNRIVRPTWRRLGD